MDSMQKELDLWRRENVDHAIALKREERWVSLSNVTEPVLKWEISSSYKEGQMLPSKSWFLESFELISGS